jgi:hypothetical protein
MGQFLDRNRAVIGRSGADELLDQHRRLPLQLINIDAGIKQQRRSAKLILARERKFVVCPARKGFRGK